MRNFEYYNPTKVYFGKKTEERAGELVKSFGGTKVLIHYGGGSARRSGVLDRVEKSLETAGISFVTQIVECSIVHITNHKTRKISFCKSRATPA